MERIDVVVIGAGVTGLASAYTAARAGHSVCVLEQHPRPGLETSTRNSGVIHAGIYHPPGALKSTLCLRGSRLLYEFCAARQVRGQLMPVPEPYRLGHGIQCLALRKARAAGQQLGRQLDPLGQPTALFSRVLIEQVVQHVQLEGTGGLGERLGMGQLRRHGSSNAGDVRTVRSPSAR